MHTCRKREQEYELSKYKDDKTEVWDDDEMEDSEHLGEYTREEMDAILDEKPEPPSLDEDDDFEGSRWKVERFSPIRQESNNK